MRGHAHKTEILIDLHCNAKDKTEFTVRPKTDVPVPGRSLVLIYWKYSSVV